MSYSRRSKIMMGAPLSVLALFLIACGSGSTESAGDDAAPVAAAEGAAPAAEGAAPAAEAPAAAINTPVRDGKFEFTVTGVERIGTTVGEGMLAETAQGEFIIVRVNVTNIGNEAAMLDSSSQKLINASGQEFSASSAIFALPDATKAFVENINPGNAVTGAPLLFDVAPGTQLGSIELHDSMFSGGVSVNLAGS